MKETNYELKCLVLFQRQETGFNEFGSIGPTARFSEHFEGKFLSSFVAQDHVWSAQHSQYEKDRI